MTVLLVVSFLLFWAGAALLLSCLPWFQGPVMQSRRQEDWIEALETWVARY